MIGWNTSSSLLKELFYNTGIPLLVFGFFVEKDKQVFIDVSEMGFLKDCIYREFADEDMDKISEIYHNWRRKSDKYEDTKDFVNPH